MVQIVRRARHRRRKVGLAVRTPFHHNSNELVLSLFVIHLLGDDLCFGSYPSFSTVCLSGICFVANNGDLCDFWVGDHPFHKRDGVVALLQIPFVKDHVDARLAKFGGQF